MHHMMIPTNTRLLERVHNSPVRVRQYSISISFESITTQANINFGAFWTGAKVDLQAVHGDATKVLLRMEVDTEDPEPDPVPNMPRKTEHGNTEFDDRQYQDDMNVCSVLRDM